MTIMLRHRIDTAFIVGAGFSFHAGLPLTSRFTKAILEARQFDPGPSRVLVDFLTTFIHDAFDHSKKAGAPRWPELEDIFTCLDLSANTGHHLGSSFSPADLRTVRRALLSRTIRMLNQKFRQARKRKDEKWKMLDDFFLRIEQRPVGFISMNWDTVIESKLDATQAGIFLTDYCCDAVPARIADSPNPEDYRSRREFLKALAKDSVISLVEPTVERNKIDRVVPIVKIHGSSNWLYCDNCRQLFYFAPDKWMRIANQLISKDDLARITSFLRRGKDARDAIAEHQSKPPLNCVCSNDVPLATRIATFSYRKALDFPMFQKSWFAAEDLLRSARTWVFVGYSLPPADFEFKYLLKRVQLSRLEKPRFIVVTGGGKADVARTRDNYQKFFGRSIKESDIFSKGLDAAAQTAIFG